MKPMPKIKYLSRLVPDLFFPPRCAGCGEIIRMQKRVPFYEGTPDESCFLHKKCCNSFQKITDSFCSKCGTPLAGRQSLCPRCQEGPRAFEACRSLLVYEGAARKAILAVKYHDRLEYCDYFAYLTRQQLGAWIREKKISCLIPVPVHKRKLKSRGYNQALELARRIGAYMDIPVQGELLIRSKNTQAQKELSPEERSMNLMGAFDAAKALPPGSIVLLVDDIYTTGATMDACAWILRTKAGACKVYALSMCAAAMKNRT